MMLLAISGAGPEVQQVRVDLDIIARLEASQEFVVGVAVAAVVAVAGTVDVAVADGSGVLVEVGIAVSVGGTVAVGGSRISLMNSPATQPLPKPTMSTGYQV